MPPAEQMISDYKIVSMKLMKWFEISKIPLQTNIFHKTSLNARHQFCPIEKEAGSISITLHEPTTC